jgi:hypothetical protein
MVFSCFMALVYLFPQKHPDFPAQRVGAPDIRPIRLDKRNSQLAEQSRQPDKQSIYPDI